jgi:thioredoxin reductase (NADPH)
MRTTDTFDCETLIIGGGPAGLSAALYLARFDRGVLLFDAGHGRSTFRQINRNFLGFPGGVPALKLRELGRQQLAEYEHVTCLNHKIESIERDGDGFRASGQAGEWRGKAVIIATGVVDHYPHFDGWDEYVGRSMFWCITCDGYACKGERVVVIGNSNATASEALQLSRFARELTVLTNSRACHIDETFQRRLARSGIALVHDQIDRVVGQDGYIRQLWTEGGRCVELDKLFSVQGATPQSELAHMLGVALGDEGFIETNESQETNLPGVFAAGDVTRLFNHQVATAVHEGAEAACAANYYLYPPELKDE